MTELWIVGTLPAPVARQPDGWTGWPRKIDGIKLIRELTGFGLKEAKHLIEQPLPAQLWAGETLRYGTTGEFVAWFAAAGYAVDVRGAEWKGPYKTPADIRDALLQECAVRAAGLRRSLIEYADILQDDDFRRRDPDTGEDVWLWDHDTVVAYVKAAFREDL